MSHGIAQGSGGDERPLGIAYDRCVRCGLCLPACPTYVETLVETSGPRGRIALIKAVDEGRLAPDSPGFLAQIAECLGCRACEAACPSGVPFGALFEAAREQAERIEAPRRPAHVRLARWFALYCLVARPGLLRAAAALLRFYQRSGIRASLRASGLIALLGLDALDALAPEMSPRFFVPGNERRPARGAARKATAFVHAGCVQSVAFAAVNDATVRVLQRAGCDVVSPPAQGCCGALATHAGDADLGRRLARRNIAAFERSGADAYVVNAAGCGAALKGYATLLSSDPEWRERATAFAGRVRDVNEFLDAIGIDPALGPLAMTVAYQDPCHLASAQGITQAPRRLLARIPELVLREMADSALCCGSAGAYALTQPAMSRRLRDRKVAAVIATGANVVATANPGCALQIAAGLHAQRQPATVKHVVELLDDAYAAYKPTSRASSPRAASTVG